MSKIIKIDKILELLPHRYPFLLVDKVEVIEEKKKAVGYKNVTINEPFFQGHFPGHPIMPGVLIAEAMAQVAGIMMLRERPNKLPYLTGLDKIRFKKPVIPGDQLCMEAKLVGMKSNIVRFAVEARVDKELVAKGEVMFALVPKDD